MEGDGRRIEDIDDNSATVEGGNGRECCWCIGLMLSVLTLSGTVTGTWIGFLFIALTATSTTQLLGASEIVLLRFSEPVLQDSFAVPTGNLVAVAFMTAAVGGTIGAAVGLGQIFGIAGGTGLLRTQDRSTR